ncbi:NADH-quinone oxidoreductase subunit L [Chloracidobacterium validum]|uniref:NADH-quinone oxidoreductase subunit L n=1 Tax=Chloracidobacterium validum TaxID=2821543 RepID=A0ABX8B6U0_9BACT|nr:NADH-quinone oxidoreductase subunit L [Chloracidobacterium validum]QUW02679.1 NADH-quinone oxidoreductase subunit L [Chloracidobacterium validum]
MYLVALVPFFPLLGFVINGLFAKRLGFSEKVIGAIACTMVAASFVCSAVAVYEFSHYAHDANVQKAAKQREAALMSQMSGAEDKEALRAKQAIKAQSATEAGDHTAAGDPKDEGHEVVATPYIVTLFEWMPGGAMAATLGPNAGQAMADFSVKWAYQLDQLSGLYILFVTFVAFFIHLFAIGYMHGDPSFHRFFAYLNLFMFMMLNLVLGANFLMTFVGWEGVGLASYLLIGYYLKKPEAGVAAKKAFVMNRVGDFGLMLAMMATFAVFGTLDYADVMVMVKALPQEPLGLAALSFTGGTLTVIALLIFLGAAGKSAQIPLYTWLPDAMAGPTPVSALIHAATMVTAGVYLVARCNPLFQRAPTAMLTVAVIGIATAFVAATIGITQTDIKKALAYSTVSQLGYMFVGCGVGAFVAGVFHVVTHAFFKAQLFLGSGSVIHGGSPSGHQQEMTYYGNFRKYMPITFATMMVSLFAICGIIPFAGFFSKDEILAKALHTPVFSHEIGLALYAMGFLTAGVTAFYMTRLMCLTFFGKERFLEGPDFQPHKAGDGHDHGDDHGQGPASKDFHPHESPLVMTLPLVVLAVFALVAGFAGVSEELTGGAFPNYVHHWLAPVMDTTLYPEKPVTAINPTEWLLAIVSVIWALAMMGLAYFLYVIRPELPEKLAQTLRPLYVLSVRKWFWDDFIDVYLVGAFKKVNLGAWGVDFVVDSVVNFFAWLTRASSVVFRTVQTGLMQNYVLVMALGIFLFIAGLGYPLFRELFAPGSRPSPPSQPQTSRVIQP